MLLARLLRDPRVPRRAKLVALFGIGYVLSPIDLLPALLLGPLGLLDDLVVVTAALSRLINHVHPDVVRSAWPGRGDALDAIQRAAGGRSASWARSCAASCAARCASSSARNASSLRGIAPAA